MKLDIYFLFLWSQLPAQKSPDLRKYRNEFVCLKNHILWDFFNFVFFFPVEGSALRTLRWNWLLSPTSWGYDTLPKRYHEIQVPLVAQGQHHFSDLMLWLESLVPKAQVESLVLTIAALEDRPSERCSGHRGLTLVSGLVLIVKELEAGFDFVCSHARTMASASLHCS